MRAGAPSLPNEEAPRARTGPEQPTKESCRSALPGACCFDIKTFTKSSDIITPCFLSAEAASHLFLALGRHRGVPWRSEPARTRVRPTPGRSPGTSTPTAGAHSLHSPLLRAFRGAATDVMAATNVQSPAVPVTAPVALMPPLPRSGTPRSHNAKSCPGSQLGRHHRGGSFSLWWVLRTPRLPCPPPNYPTGDAVSPLPPTGGPHDITSMPGDFLANPACVN